MTRQKLIFAFDDDDVRRRVDDPDQYYHERLGWTQLMETMREIRDQEETACQETWSRAKECYKAVEAKTDEDYDSAMEEQARKRRITQSYLKLNWNSNMVQKFRAGAAKFEAMQLSTMQCGKKLEVALAERIKQWTENWGGWEATKNQNIIDHGQWCLGDDLNEWETKLATFESM